MRDICFGVNWFIQTFLSAEQKGLDMQDYTFIKFEDL